MAEILIEDNKKWRRTNDIKYEISFRKAFNCHISYKKAYMKKCNEICINYENIGVL
jgi:hypothetical protein